MLLDKYLTFSEGQVVTVTADSTNILDLRDNGDDLGRLLNLFVLVSAVVTADGSATVTFTVETCATEGGSYEVIYTSGAIGKAALTAGAKPVDIALPTGLKRYVKVVYTVATGPLTGVSAFTAGITPSRDKA